MAVTGVLIVFSCHRSNEVALLAPTEQLAGKCICGREVEQGLKAQIFMSNNLRHD